MDNMFSIGEIENSGSSSEVESVVRTTSKKFEDGSSEEVRVEQVEGGYIKTVCTRKKDKDGCWQYEEEKSVHTEDPMKDNSSEGIATRLESILKNIM
jgi:hypothetical protein